MKRVNYLTGGAKDRLMNEIQQVKARLEQDPDIIKAKLDEAYHKKQNLHLFGRIYKTSRVVRDWFKENEDKVAGYYVIGPLQKTFFDKTLFLNGHTVKGQIFVSDEIDNIASYPNRVILVDEYQLMDKNAQEHILLLQEGYVVDFREEKGYKKLDNIRFVCVIENKE